jgi:integrase/recombinase XerD
MKIEQSFLGPWLKRFLLEYLISVKNLSRNTQQSYRDTFRLYLPYLAKKIKKSVDQLTTQDMSSKSIENFLLNIELERHCSIATRNQRLTAIHAFAEFVGLNSPEHTEWCRQVHSIPFKRGPKATISYLEKDEMDALLNAPDQSTKIGKRDYVLLLFLYNTGARADELAQLTIGDLDISRNPKKNVSLVTIRGKGKKFRRCPLWDDTCREILPIISGREATEHVFINRYKKPITRFGVHTLVKKYAKQLFPQYPALTKKRVSPHTIRHTTATHLLQAGVDINTIRAWLGHVSLDTTNVYVEVNLEMKAKALACCEVSPKHHHKYWRNDKNLMNFLESL